MMFSCASNLIYTRHGKFWWGTWGSKSSKIGHFLVSNKPIWKSVGIMKTLVSVENNRFETTNQWQNWSLPPKMGAAGLRGCDSTHSMRQIVALFHKKRCRCFLYNWWAIHPGCPVNVPLNTYMYSSVFVQKLGPNPCFQQSITVFACKNRCVPQTPLMDDWYCLVHPEIIQAEAWDIWYGQTLSSFPRATRASSSNMQAAARPLVPFGDIFFGWNNSLGC